MTRCTRLAVWFSVAALVVVGGLGTARAQTTWITTVTSGSWGDSANWSSGTVPSGNGQVVDFASVDFAANRVINLGAARTVGTMTVGDTSGSQATQFTGNTLTINGTGASITNGSGALTISSIFTAGSDLTIRANEASGITIAPASTTGITLSNRTVTNSGTGSGTLLFNTGGAAGTNFNAIGTTLVQDSATSMMRILGTQWAGEASNSGTVSIRSGTFSYASNRNDTLGGGSTAATGMVIQLGDPNGGSKNAFYVVDGANATTGTLTNPLQVAATTTGVLTLRSSGLSRVFNGGLTGSNSITIDSPATQTIAFDTTALNNVGAITHIGNGTGALTINADIGANVTGLIQNSASSALILNGNKTYSGPTTITAGTLSLGATGTIANSGTISIASGAFFDVASVSGGYVLANTQTLGGKGTLAGNATLAGSSLLAFDPTGPLIATGTLVFDAGFGIDNLVGANWDSLTLNSPYTVVQTSQSFSALSIENFGSTNAAAVGSAGRSAYYQNGTSGNLELVVVPEPTTLAMALGGVACLGWVIRRRRKA